jgi:hypothetical protein
VSREEETILLLIFVLINNGDDEQSREKGEKRDEEEKIDARAKPLTSCLSLRDISGSHVPRRSADSRSRRGWMQLSMASPVL